jgi:hypothetical protein
LSPSHPCRRNSVFRQFPDAFVPPPVFPSDAFGGSVGFLVDGASEDGVVTGASVSVESADMNAKEEIQKDEKQAADPENASTPTRPYAHTHAATETASPLGTCLVRRDPIAQLP